MEAALYKGGKVVWMPTMHSRCHADFYGTTTGYGFIQGTTLRPAEQPISILNEDGSVRDDVLQVVSLVAEYDAILATAHISKLEASALLDAARDIGLRKFLITHPHFKFLDYSDDELVSLAERGAILELCSGTVQTIPAYTTVQVVAQTIKAVGAKHCIISSDTGSPRKPTPPETTAAYLYCLRVLGIPEDELHIMAVEAPLSTAQFQPVGGIGSACFSGDASLRRAPLGIDDVLPPVPRDAVAFADDMREVAQPPTVVLASVAIAPLTAADGRGSPLRSGKSYQLSHRLGTGLRLPQS